MKPRIVKLAPNAVPIIVKYGSAGRDLVIPAGRHAWMVDHGTWTDTYLTRREARAALAKYLAT